MNVSLVVTCWNGRALLEKNLPQVLQAAGNPKNRVEQVLVVDDYSSDGSVAYLKQNHPTVEVVTHPENRGYGAVCNTGVEIAREELVAIVNLDVLPTDNFLQAAVPRFEDDRVFAVSFNEGKYGPGKLGWRNGFLEIIPNSKIPKATAKTDWASGGSAVFRKKYWLELGGMDRLFLPFYFEDIDLGIRAYRAGYYCLWEPKSKVVHQHEATINKENLARYKSQIDIDLIKQRNHLLLTWKNLHRPDQVGRHLYHLFRRCAASPGYLRVILAGVRRLFSCWLSSC